MKKYIFMLYLLLFPVYVYATNKDSGVYLGPNLAVCTDSKYQDESVVTDGSTYFSHCMEARCTNGKYKIYYNNKNKVTCSNGNTSPYVNVVKSGCADIDGKSCSSKLYCSIIIEYDCTRKNNGDSFTTKTTTKTTTKKVNATTTTTETTTTVVTEPTTEIKKDTRLKSLSLSSGAIDFSSDVYSYTIEVLDDVDSINVTAVPMDESSEVLIEGNIEIVNGSTILVKVINDDSESIYNISVTKKEKEKSNNAYLKSLKIRNHDITFNKKVFNYLVIVESNENELDIYELNTEDENAVVEVKNNSNLTNGSKVDIVVTSENEEVINTYTIDIKVKKKSNFIKVLFTFIIILAIIAGGYYVYKKFVMSKKGDKYEYE